MLSYLKPKVKKNLLKTQPVSSRLLELITRGKIREGAKRMLEGQGGKLGRVRRWGLLTLDLEEMNDFFFKN